MNTIYRIVWNDARRVWVVASELVKGAGKKASGGVDFRGKKIAGEPECLCIRLSVIGEHRDGTAHDNAARWKLSKLVAALLAVGWLGFSGNAFGQCTTGGGTISTPTTGGCTVSTDGSTVSILSGGTFTGWINFNANNTVLGIDQGGSFVANSGIAGNPQPVSVSGTGASNPTWTVNNNGSMTVASTIAWGLISRRTSGTLIVNNTGTIQNNTTSNLPAIASLGDGMIITVTNSGMISANAGPAIWNDGAGTTTVVNQTGGTIQSLGNYAIYEPSITSLSITNEAGATITTSSTNSTINSGGSTTLRNAGTISVASPATNTAMSLSGVNDLLILEPTSVINGIVQANGGTNTLALGGGSGSGTFNLSLIGGTNTQQYRSFSTFQKIEGDTWTLTGSNTNLANLTWSLAGGTLILDNTGTLTGNVVNPSTATGPVSLQVARPITPSAANGLAIDMEGPFSNTIALNTGASFTTNSGQFKVGAGVTTLTGPVAFPNLVTIAGGTLQVGDGGAGTGGSITGNITDNAALIFNHSDNVTYGGVVSGSGTLAQSGTGTLTLSGANTYTGGSFLNNGILAVSNNNNLGGAATRLTFNGGTLRTTVGLTNVTRPITLNTTGTIDNAGNNDSFNGLIDGVGSLTSTGTGNLTLAANNTYSGGTVLAAGTLTMGNASALGTGILAMAAGTTLDFLGSYTVNNAVTLSGSPTFNVNTGLTTTWTGNISDGTSPGVLNRTGAGTLVLSGTSTYSGGSTLGSGTVVATDGSVLGTGVISNSAALQLNFASNSTLANTLSGTDSLTKSGAGVATLSAAGSGEGAVSVNTGTLQFSQSGAFNAVDY
ncbi:ESPR-type extended signal peptide-containing protein, partial [Paraburkholderia sediminicola]|uniref:autotransporter-associated beta strand repeat-containing protein n=1 Tax=Paraburkholderia sediminicola TaxID=458836 RepID=UPI0038B86647